jgi:hypothetical protein
VQITGISRRCQENSGGSIPFTDGTVRPVFLDTAGRQFILDDEGQPVYGVWVYIDKPEIVNRTDSCEE